MIHQLDGWSGGVVSQILDLNGVSIDLKQPACGELWLDIDEEAIDDVCQKLTIVPNLLKAQWCGPNAPDHKHLLVLEHWH